MRVYRCLTTVYNTKCVPLFFLFFRVSYLLPLPFPFTVVICDLVWDCGSDVLKIGSILSYGIEFINLNTIIYCTLEIVGLCPQFFVIRFSLKYKSDRESHGSSVLICPRRGTLTSSTQTQVYTSTFYCQIRQKPTTSTWKQTTWCS